MTPETIGTFGAGAAAGFLGGIAAPFIAAVAVYRRRERETQKELQAARAPRWIPVEERKPDTPRQVLVFLCGNCGRYDMAARDGRGWGHRLGWFDSDPGCGFWRVHGAPDLDGSVTHWKELTLPTLAAASEKCTSAHPKPHP